MSKVIRVVRTVTYESDEADLIREMKRSLPVGERQYGNLKIRVEHTHGPQWPTDGEDVRKIEGQLSEEPLHLPVPKKRRRF